MSKKSKRKKKGGGVLSRPITGPFPFVNERMVHPFDTPITAEDRRLATLHLKLRTV